MQTETTSGWRAESAARNAAIDARLSALEIGIHADFVPASTFKDDEWKRSAVNFNLTIAARGTVIYRGPYAYGVGHLPEYDTQAARVVDGDKAIKRACETGLWGGKFGEFIPKPVPAPTLRDVMYSLLSDADAIDHGSFESWAIGYGYDTDSRSAEAIYRACVDTGLKLRAALGDAVLAELRELFQDY